MTPYPRGMPDLMRQGQGMRRRGGAPMSTLAAAAPPPPPPSAHDVLAEQYHQSGGWMGQKEAKAAMGMVDQLHGLGVGKSVHADLVAANIIRKSRARSTTYHWNG